VQQIFFSSFFSFTYLIFLSMPELPEVETIAADLRQVGLVGAKILDARVYWPRTLAHLSPPEFVRQISGQSIKSISRRAKYLCFHLSGGATLFVHLRMTGRFELVKGNHAAIGEHERLCLFLDRERTLKYHDTRKFGRWFLVEDPLQVIGKLGPEP